MSVTWIDEFPTAPGAQRVMNIPRQHPGAPRHDLQTLGRATQQLGQATQQNGTRLSMIEMLTLAGVLISAVGLAANLYFIAKQGSNRLASNRQLLPMEF